MMWSSSSSPRKKGGANSSTPVVDDAPASSPEKDNANGSNSSSSASSSASSNSSLSSPLSLFSPFARKEKSPNRASDPVVVGSVRLRADSKEILAEAAAGGGGGGAAAGSAAAADSSPLRQIVEEKTRENQILHESLDALCEQLRQVSLRLEERNEEIRLLKEIREMDRRSLDVLGQEVDQLQATVRLKEERIQGLQEKLDKYQQRTTEKLNSPVAGAATGPLSSPMAMVDNPFSRIMKQFRNTTALAEDLKKVSVEYAMVETSNNLASNPSSVEDQDTPMGLSRDASIGSAEDDTKDFMQNHGESESDMADIIGESLREAITDELQLYPSPAPGTVDYSVAQIPEEDLPLIAIRVDSAEDFDRFGFLIDEFFNGFAASNLLKQKKKHFDSIQQAHEDQQRLKFDALLARKPLGTTYRLGKNDEWKPLIRGGIPNNYRAQFWKSICGSLEIWQEGAYEQFLKNYDGHKSLATQQIELDVHRTLPNNVYFQSYGAIGIPRLRRLLVAYSWRNPLVGYCQGMNLVAAILLLVLSEEDAFWVFAAVIEKILPANYYTSNLLVSQADQRVLKDLVTERLPRLVKHLEHYNVDLTLITFTWFISLFVDCLPSESLFRMWDTFLSEGPKVLFRFSMGLLKLNEKNIIGITESSSLFNFLKNMTTRVYDIEELMKVSFNELNPFPRSKIHMLQKRHIAYVKAEQNVIEQHRREMEESLLNSSSSRARGQGHLQINSGSSSNNDNSNSGHNETEQEHEPEPQAEPEPASPLPLPADTAENDDD